MILSFSKKFPWGDPTHFKEKILDGTKIHTIRKDPHRRWREGMKIHFATGVRTPNYNQFNYDVCTGVQEIEIKDYGDKNPLIIIDGYGISPAEMKTLAWNDGFDGIQDFRKWFNKPFKGRLIHWSDLRY